MSKLINISPEDNITRLSSRLVRGLEQAHHMKPKKPVQWLFDGLSGFIQAFTNSKIVMDSTVQDKFEHVMNALEAIIFALLQRFCSKNRAYFIVDTLAKNLARRISAEEWKEEHLIKEDI
jgi:hypothetical protein